MYPSLLAIARVPRGRANGTVVRFTVENRRLRVRVGDDSPEMDAGVQLPDEVQPFVCLWTDAETLTLRGYCNSDCE